MEAEADPFVKHLDLTPLDSSFWGDDVNLPFVGFQGDYEGCKVTVATSGKDAIYGTGVDNVGTVSAAMMTFLAIQTLKSVDLVLNAGTCGGFKRKGAEIGDVFVTTGVANHDRRIAIPGFTEWGIGKLEAVAAPNLLKVYPLFKSGICTTGNSLDKTEECDKLMLSNDASVKDMEAAAIAWSCALLSKKVPYLGIKVVTDIVDGDQPTHEEFMKNLGTAAESLQNALPQVLKHVCGRDISDL
eukprot:CAMPEP_0178922392 /NCGR_PEP_ID=MMETSP0786-20121207/16126_1 /TAXON_ID=186022 /ORGANISM="Thalassionema frauenfeldii, Strain CCMP 1798" /LENGTH=241 /DNA_ID=CAMNT_0020596747 /DNA_START=149 /DNA_END=874 /DNA_ORIENTATION=-